MADDNLTMQGVFNNHGRDLIREGNSGTRPKRLIAIEERMQEKQVLIKGPI